MARMTAPMALPAIVRTVVCDDERLVRERVAALVRAASGFEVVGEAEHGAAAVDAIGRLRPDLVLLDIQMPELDGFEVVSMLDPPRPLVVFITAYDAHALRAFDAHALDYILKPIDVGRFQTMLERVRGRLAGAATADSQLAAWLDAQRAATPLRRLAVREGDRTIILPLDRVRWIDAADDSARVHAEGRGYALRTGVGELAARLPPTQFLRIHRSTLVNLDWVREVLPWAHGEYVVVMDGGQRLHVSRTYAAAVRRVLRNEA